ncbi:MAG: FAD-dependent oxidoreductase [Dehalococcoidia bacterium]|nr:FAD-dependent oxidoreductase [Dehalococcoidia bacterium]
MRIAVIGAGAAGLTAAYRLTQAGHRVTVYEANPYVGGRAHSEHFGPGHHLDTGAGWLTSAYTSTLALFEELGERERLQPMRASAPAELLVEGKVYLGTGLPRTPAGEHLVPADERERLRNWLRRLEGYPPLGYRTFNDQEDADAHLAPVSPAAARFLFAPMFEGLFAPLAEQSAEFLRSWIAASRVQYFQVQEGMDAPWKRVASHLEVHVNARVEMIRQGGNRMEVVANGMGTEFDGIVVAVPPPVGKRFVTRAIEPRWVAQLGYEQIRYSGQCRLYLATPGDAPARVHRRQLPMGLIASVEWQSGGQGAWGACPGGWQWALICGNEGSNTHLANLPDGEVAGQLWTEAAKLVPGLPPLKSWNVRHVVRWENAVPTMVPGHFTRMAAYQRRPPLVFAGDWTHQACIEGAVRSGEAAAEAFGPG